MRLRRFLFVTLSKVLLEDFFHFLQGQRLQLRNLPDLLNKALGADVSFFRQLHNFRERRSCIIRARPAVINKHTGIFEAVFLCVFL